MIRVKCPKCGKLLGVDDSRAGGMGACPACGQKFRIPGGKGPVAVKPPAAPKTKPARPPAALPKKKKIEEEEDTSPYAMEQAPASPEPQRRPRVEDEDEEDEDEEEDEGLLSFEKEYARKKRKREEAAKLVKEPAKWLRLATKAFIWVQFGLAGGNIFFWALGEAPFFGIFGKKVWQAWHPGAIIALIVAIPVVLWFFGILILIGADRMRRLEAYGFAVTACILSMLGLSPAGFLAFPLGLWCFIVLLREEVKSQFSRDDVPI